MLPSDWHVRLSRRVNGWRGGDPGLMLCAELHADGSRWCVVIDAAFRLIRRGERRHCRDMWVYERERRRAPGLVERVRSAGW